MSKCLYVFYNFSTQQSYKLDWFFISFYVFFAIWKNNAIYAITYRLLSELIKCPFSSTQPHGNSVGKRAFQKVAGLGIQRFYFEACLLHGRYYFLLGNALGLHGKYLVLVGRVHFPMADALCLVQVRLYRCDTAAAIDVRLELKLFIFHCLQILELSDNANFRTIQLVIVV